LGVWRGCFPRAFIAGAGIGKSVLFEDERIHTGFIDRTSALAAGEFFASLAPEHPDRFDIMIDDGPRTAGAAVCLFENPFSRLKYRGFYMIEDTAFTDITRFKPCFKNSKYAGGLSVDCMLMSKPDENNNLVIVRGLKNRRFIG
jgi:hypothetical protein